MSEAELLPTDEIESSGRSISAFVLVAWGAYRFDGKILADLEVVVWL